MSRPSLRSLGVLAASGAAAVGTAFVPMALAASPASAHAGGGSLTAVTVLEGSSLSHTFTVADVVKSEPLANPDDITRLGDEIFVGFQNGVGPQGQASTSGNSDSTVVEMTPFGREVAQWDIQGKADGVTADPDTGQVIATVNEDANSSLYAITPGPGGGVQHYAYNKPLPHNGGTDAISILNGSILISASAPGTTGTLPAPQPTFPAVYKVRLDAASSVATVKAAFYDEAPARVANTNAPNYGKFVKLALTDPDSNEIVPAGMPRFGGQFMLTSQGDEEQIFLGNPGGPNHELSVLKLTQSVDDTAFPGGPGVLYATDSTHDTVDAILGAFPSAPVAAATPCGANDAPATCPAPPSFPPNYLASINPWTGQVTQLPVGGAAFVPQGGLLYMPLPTAIGGPGPQGQNEQGQNGQ
jgi:hypothetical protein